MKTVKKADTLMVEMARFIEEHCESRLSLMSLARQALMSPAHFQKCFKAAIGVTPKEYQDACRLKKFKSHLRTKKNVTDSIYETGHGSPSRVYEKLSDRVGMTPVEYKKSGQGLEISYATAKTALGKLMIGATDRGICFIQFGESEASLVDRLKDEFPSARLQAMDQANRQNFDLWIQILNEYLAGNQVALDLPLDIQGTAFQIRVWRFLQQIPKGETVSYTTIAKRMGQPRAVRAVANACARNRIAIVIPCHRVLRGSGALSGYRWGVDRKHALLVLEKAIEEK